STRDWSSDVCSSDLVCGGPLIVFLVALIAQYWAPEEPLIFFSGISIWPTEMVRLIAFMLAIFFMFKASFDLRNNARRIEADYSRSEERRVGKECRSR